MAKKNVHPHRLGTGGYYGKEELFRKMEEEAKAAGTYTMEGISERGRNWVLAREKGAAKQLKFNNPETERVAMNIKKYAEDRQKGLFTPSRERDDLSLGLGNPEHTGRVRGVGKTMTWKEGWEDDKDMYRKHGRDRETDLQRRLKEMVDMALTE